MSELSRLRSMVYEIQGDLDADPDRQNWPRITVRRWLRWLEVETAELNDIVPTHKMMLELGRS